jgi:hypothetical protein
MLTITIGGDPNKPTKTALKCEREAALTDAIIVCDTLAIEYAVKGLGIMSRGALNCADALRDMRDEWRR